MLRSNNRFLANWYLSMQIRNRVKITIIGFQAYHIVYAILIIISNSKTTLTLVVEPSFNDSTQVRLPG